MHRAPPLAARLCAVVVAAAAAAQVPADLAELATQVETTHRTAAAAAVTAFHADLRIQELASDAKEHRGELELAVDFLDWKKPDTGKPFPLIRYRQSDSARAVEQGRDRVWFWSISNGKAQDMQAKEMANDVEHCKRNIKLARQLIQFLDPASVLRGLAEPSPVQDEVLPVADTERAAKALGRAQARVPCRTVSGRLAGFPLRQQSGDDAPVLAKVFVSRDDHRLEALEVRPLGADAKPAAGGGEFLLFNDYQLLSGRLVPMQVRHFAIEVDGKRQQQMSVDIVRLDLDAKLTAESFDRPK